MIGLGLFPPAVMRNFDPSLRHFTTDNAAVTADATVLTADKTKAPQSDVPQESV